MLTRQPRIISDVDDVIVAAKSAVNIGLRPPFIKVIFHDGYYSKP